MNYRSTINHYFKKDDGYKVDDVNELFNMMTTVIIYKNLKDTNITNDLNQISQWYGGAKNKTKRENMVKGNTQKRKTKLESLCLSPKLHHEDIHNYTLCLYICPTNTFSP